MKINVKKTSLPGVLLIERYAFTDFRGRYGEIYARDAYREAGINIDFKEQDFSVSRKNVLRGLHGDSKTWKLISCLHGSFYMVVLNFDRESKYFGKWEAFTLSPENQLQILVPPKHGNGHLVLTDRAIFHYNQSEYYSGAENQFTVRWDDSKFNIKWPISEKPILSKRDAEATYITD
ncbi:MAG: dTDP-4-dehydrorhamnose 3,5-epimerase family protein [Patescibacteria group bacterium]